MNTKDLSCPALIAALACLSGPLAAADDAHGPSAASGVKNAAVEALNLPVERAVLTQPPQVPPPITRKTPAKVVVNLEVLETVKKLADGVEYTFWTYGGDVPGSFIRVREGDVVEFHLNNHPSSKVPHNIDLHAVTGPGGGAASSFTAPGHSSQFTFQAINPGLYVYHCATAPVPMHIGNGMYGLILVEPREGLPKVDREFYVMQGEVYTSGKYGEEGLQSFDNAKAVDERPPYVVFNGGVGSLVGDKALQAKVGENVRIYFGVGGPNVTSSFHVIGEIFDKVYQEGGIRASQEQVQTTMVPAGGSAMVEFKVDVPGTFILVDHSLSRAFNKGCLGMLKVTGPENKVVYSGKEVDEVYIGSQAGTGSDSGRKEAELVARRDAAIKSNPDIAKMEREIVLERGKRVFLQNCVACHMAEGQGLPGVFPPLAKSDFLMADRERAISIVLKGLSGEITVNGAKFNGAMPPLEATMTDQQIADVLSFVTNTWGNTNPKPYGAEEVRRVRSAK